MTTEFAEGGYAKLEAAIREIEELAWDGTFAAGLKAAARFHQIAGKAKALRQILLETAVHNPFGGGGEAA
jgi:hypothetical protein